MQDISKGKILDYEKLYDDYSKFRIIIRKVTWEETVSQIKKGEILIGIYNFRETVIAIPLTKEIFELMNAINYEYQHKHIVRLSGIYAIAKKDMKKYYIV